LDEFPQEGHFTSHDICGQCVARYMRTKILDDGSTSVLCPESSCKAPLEYSEIGQHAAKDVFARYLPPIHGTDVDMMNYFVEERLKRIPTFDGAQTESVKLVRSSLTAVPSPV
jgi:hypothetical protein